MLDDIYIQGVAIKKWPPWNFCGFEIYFYPFGSLCIRVLLCSHYKLFCGFIQLFVFFRHVFEYLHVLWQSIMESFPWPKV